MTLYSTLVLIHVVAAIIGIGPTFIFPLLRKMPKTTEQLKEYYAFMKKVEVYPKIGGILLILTGLGMGVLNTHLFTQFWFDAALVLFVIIEIFVIGIIGKRMKPLMEELNAITAVEIPEAFLKKENAIGKFHGIVTLLTIVIIVLMVLKPLLNMTFQ